MKASFSTDTICAIATPCHGPSAVAVIRISGTDAIDIVSSLIARDSKRRKVRYGRRRLIKALLEDVHGRMLDEVLVVSMKSPKTYTGEDLVEIHCHGGIVTRTRIVEALCKVGCRVAEPGEFTRRAVLNGKMTLLQAEAVNELVMSTTSIAAETALHGVIGDSTRWCYDIRNRLIDIIALLETDLDFPDEDSDVSTRNVDDELARIDAMLATTEESCSRERYVRNGILSVLGGAVNVGKSTLFNRLLGCERAIVTTQPGTTRDLLEESLIIEGVMFRFVDTAGVRTTDCPIELEGMRRADDAARNADVLIEVFDARDVVDTRVPPATSSNVKCHIRVANKSDLVSTSEPSVRTIEDMTFVSALTGDGMEGLTEKLKAAAEELLGRDHATTCNGVMGVRQRDGIRKAREALGKAREASSVGHKDIAADEIRNAAGRMADMIGPVADDEVYDRIFSTFCLGK